MNNASVQEKKLAEALAVSDGQFSEIQQATLRGVVPFISRLRQFGGAQRFATGNVVADAVSSALLALLPKRVRMEGEEVEWWQKYYFDCYTISVDLSELEVPAPLSYPTRLVVMHSEVSTSCNRIVPVYRKRCSEKGFVWWQFTDDLDGVIKSHDRSGTYAIRVVDSPESEFGEKDGQNFSTKQVLDRGVVTTTLPERLVDGDSYLLRTGNHLDSKKVNLCPGTKLASGNVPSVSFVPDNGWVYVNDWDSDDAHGCLRFRSAIC